jgi:hypothetical protein
MKTVHLMLFLDMITAYFENNINSTNTLSGEIEQLFMCKLVAHIVTSTRMEGLRGEVMSDDHCFVQGQDRLWFSLNILHCIQV